MKGRYSINQDAPTLHNNLYTNTGNGLVIFSNGTIIEPTVPCINQVNILLR